MSDNTIKKTNTTPVVIAKAILGVAFLVFGANGFLHFLPVPPPDSANGLAFLKLMDSTGYLKVVKALEMVAGGLILGGRLAPLGLLILGPILVNIILFDIFMDPMGLPVVGVFGALALFVVWRHKEHFTPFFAVRAEHCTFKGK
jgi:putative oxidoreductase